MASNHHTDVVFMDKKRPKRPIRFNVTLNEEQKQAKKSIIDNPVTVLKGMAGSGKTLVATQVALDLLFTKQIGQAHVGHGKEHEDQRIGGHAVDQATIGIDLAGVHAVVNDAHA